MKYEKEYSANRIVLAGTIVWLAIFGLGFFVGRATAAPLHVSAHRLNLYPNTMAVTVRGEAKGKVAHVWVDAMDDATHSAGYRPYTKRVRVRHGRFVATLFVKRLVQYQAPVPAGFNTALRYWNPDRLYPVPFDGVAVEVWSAGRTVREGLRHMADSPLVTDEAVEKALDVMRHRLGPWTARDDAAAKEALEAAAPLLVAAEREKLKKAEMAELEEFAKYRGTLMRAERAEARVAELEAERLTPEEARALVHDRSGVVPVTNYAEHVRALNAARDKLRARAAQKEGSDG